MTIAYEAMMFAREVHKDQRRKYTGNPYADHLAEEKRLLLDVMTNADPRLLAIARAQTEVA